MKKRLSVATLFLMLLPITAQPQDHKHTAMEKRGNDRMGFDQSKTTHHFLLSKDGGSIQVTANSADDVASTSAIRQHLMHIASAFRAGDFSIPMFVHDQTVPGVASMKKLKDQIAYTLEPVPNGAKMLISSENTEAVRAIHQFLRFQIKEHKTGDPLEAK